MTTEQLEKIKEFESLLDYLINPTMSIDEKLKALNDSYWRSHNAGYSNYIAGQLMAGIENDQTIKYDLDCKYQYEVELLIDLLNKYKEEIN